MLLIDKLTEDTICIENQILQCYVKLTYSLFVKPHFLCKTFNQCNISCFSTHKNDSKKIISR